MARTVIGTATTTNGVASTTYTGSGVGKKNIIAITPSVCSNEMILIDGTKYDRGLSSDYSSIWSGSTSDLSRGNEYSTLEESTVGTTSVIYTAISNTCTIELEVCITDGATSNSFMQFTTTLNTSRGTVTIASANATIGSWVSLKIDLTPTNAVVTNLDTGQTSTAFGTRR